MSAQYLAPLAMSQTKDDLLRHLSMAPETYTLMAKETDRWYKALVRDQRNLKLIVSASLHTTGVIFWRRQRMKRTRKLRNTERSIQVIIGVLRPKPKTARTGLQGGFFTTSSDIETDGIEMQQGRRVTTIRIMPAYTIPIIDTASVTMNTKLTRITLITPARRLLVRIIKDMTIRQQVHQQTQLHSHLLGHTRRIHRTIRIIQINTKYTTPAR